MSSPNDAMAAAIGNDRGAKHCCDVLDKKGTYKCPVQIPGLESVKQAPSPSNCDLRKKRK